MPRDEVEESMEEIAQDEDAEVEMSGPDAEARLFNQAWAIATVFATINAGAKHEMVSDINDLFISVNSASGPLPCSLLRTRLEMTCDLPDFLTFFLCL